MRRFRGFAVSPLCFFFLVSRIRSPIGGMLHVQSKFRKKTPIWRKNSDAQISNRQLQLTMVQYSKPYLYATAMKVHCIYELHNANVQLAHDTYAQMRASATFLRIFYNRIRRMAKWARPTIGPWVMQKDARMYTSSFCRSSKQVYMCLLNTLKLQYASMRHPRSWNRWKYKLGIDGDRHPASPSRQRPSRQLLNP